MLHGLLTPLFLFATTPGSFTHPAAAPTPVAAPQELTASSLEGEIDLSMRWLRSRFDVEARSFGSLENDLRALLAFAGSHRRYRASDGPFVAEPLKRLLASLEGEASMESPELARVAYLALESLGDAGTEAQRARLRSNLDEAGLANPYAGLGAAELRSAARGILDERDGASWGDADLARTADAVHRLSRIRAELKKAAPKKGAPREATPLPALSEVDAQRLRKAVARGTNYLFEQSVDGRWGFDGHVDPGITAMVCAALAPRLAAGGLSEEQGSRLGAALDWLVSLQKPDGSIHDGALANYVTSVAVLALSRAKRAADEPVIARAREFLVALQADEGEGYESGDLYYGGVGYGGDERPDLSNLQIALEALAESGSQPGDETFQKALRFLQRCQNHSETNDLALVRDGVTYASGNDGGAGYAPGDSKAGFIELRDGRKVPRSYGSMTYALLKGYLFAGLSKEDPRVEAAWRWLQENYTLDVNPGFQASSDPTAAYQGLFYYFYTMAKALDLYGQETLVDGAGREHAWRTELAGRLLAMQRQDGSWMNTNAARWFEGNPVLATAYAMLSLHATWAETN